jgi:hypothetical protein
MKKTLVLILVMVLFQTPAVHAADKGKEFILSVVYGTLAGTLVGAATLAFTTNPGDNLNNVARGASYGLYAGILLGLYMNYGLDDESTKRDKLNQENPNPGEVSPNPDDEARIQFQPFLIPPTDVAKKDWGIGLNFLNYKF